MLNDKFIATVKVGPKGQIVIPKEARDLFELKSGDMLILLADKSRGIALQPAECLDDIVKNFIKGVEENGNSEG